MVLSEYINFIKSFSKFKESTFDGFGILSIYSGAFLNKSRLQGVLSHHSLFTFFTMPTQWNSKTSITSSLRKLHWKIESIHNQLSLLERTWKKVTVSQKWNGSSNEQTKYISPFVQKFWGKSVNDSRTKRLKMYHWNYLVVC